MTVGPGLNTSRTGGGVSNSNSAPFVRMTRSAADTLRMQQSAILHSNGCIIIKPFLWPELREICRNRRCLHTARNDVDIARSVTRGGTILIFARQIAGHLSTHGTQKLMTFSKWLEAAGKHNRGPSYLRVLQQVWEECATPDRIQASGARLALRNFDEKSKHTHRQI